MPNEAPTANPDTLIASEDTVAVYSGAALHSNDTDADGNPLQVTAVGNAVNGTVVLNPDGTISFTPSTNFHGIASFDYIVSDGNGGTDTATATVTVGAVNDAVTLTVPTSLTMAPSGHGVLSGFSISDVDAALDPNGIYTFQIDVPDELSFGFYDPTYTEFGPDGSGGYVIGFSEGDGWYAGLHLTGTLSEINQWLQEVVYSSHWEEGTFSWTVTVSDGDGNTVASGSGPGTSDTETVSIIVDAPPAPPPPPPPPPGVAPDGTDRAVTILEDQVYTFALFDFPFTDPDGNSLASLRFTSVPTSGKIYYDPDGSGPDGGIEVFAGQTFSAAALAAGKLSFRPGAHEFGDDYAAFTFQVIDDGGPGGVNIDSTPNSFVFDVLSVNDAPSGTDATATVDTGAVYYFSASDFGFSDIENHAFAEIHITTLPDPAVGTLYVAGYPVFLGQDVHVWEMLGGSFTFEPAAGASGNVSFTFQVRDNGSTQNNGPNLDPTANSFTITVTAPPPPPPPSGPAIDLNGAASGTSAALGVLENESNAAPAIIASGAVVAGIATSLDGGTLTVQFTDGGPGDVLTIVDQGFGQNQVRAEEGLLYYGFSFTPVGSYSGGEDPSSPLVISFSAGATQSVVEAIVRRIGYQTLSDDPAGAARSVTFTIAALPGAPGNVSTATVTVTAEDDATVPTDDYSEPVAENATVVIDVLSNDDPDSAIALQIVEIGGQAVEPGSTVTLASGATVTLNAEGTLLYNPNGQFNTLNDGSSGAVNSAAYDSFSYTLGGGAGSATVMVLVTGVASADDILRGDAGNNTIASGATDDRIVGDLGDDLIDGGAGTDTAVVAAGVSAVSILSYGTDGQFQIESSDGIDLLKNVEIVEGTGSQRLVLVGNGGYADFDAAVAAANGANRDILVLADGLAGAHSFDVASGLVVDAGAAWTDLTLQLFGGNDGSSLFTRGAAAIDLVGDNFDNILGANAGANAVSGGMGYDTVSYELSAGAVTVDLMTTDRAGDAAGDTYTSIENIRGGAGADILRGSTGINLLDGGAGADTLAGRGGNDTYVVDDAGDVVTELANEGSDLVRTSLASYVLGSNIENLSFSGSGGFSGTGNGLNNSLVGGAGADSLYGMGGTDSLNGGGGADYLEGGAGNDTYILDNAGDQVVEAAASGTDTVTTSALLGYTLGANVENLTYSGTGAFTGTGNSLINTINGGSGNDTIYGLDNNDTLNGGSGADTLDGGNDNDNLSGGGGSDTLIGGAGVDMLNGGAGADTMSGGTGNDGYVVDSALDVIVEAAGEGTDTVYVNLSSYTLGAELENLNLQTSGTNTASGNALDNVITGMSAADTLSGLDGNDTLNGAGGADTLSGGNGTDLLTGGAGADLLTGGTGVDTFKYSTAETGMGAAADRITDFVAGTDRIDLSGIDASTSLSGDQAFSFIGSAAFGSVAGQLRFASSGSDTVIEGDTNGDAVADFQIFLTGTVLPAAADFVL